MIYTSPTVRLVNHSFTTRIRTSRTTRTIRGLVYTPVSLTIYTYTRKPLQRFSIAFTANGKRQAKIPRLPKTREIYLVSAYILPVSHSYGASTKTEK